MLALSAHDRHSGIVEKLRHGYQDRLTELRLQNDDEMTPEKRWKHLGRIQEVKKLLALFDEPQTTT